MNDSVHPCGHPQCELADECLIPDELCPHCHASRPSFPHKRGCPAIADFDCAPPLRADHLDWPCCELHAGIWDDFLNEVIV